MFLGDTRFYLTISNNGGAKALKRSHYVKLKDVDRSAGGCHGQVDKEMSDEILYKRELSRLCYLDLVRDSISVLCHVLGIESAFEKDALLVVQRIPESPCRVRQPTRSSAAHHPSGVPLFQVTPAEGLLLFTFRYARALS
jgi:hypothetical protein